jgi:hypothetical protein
LEEETKLGESEEEYKAKIATRNAAQDERKELQRRDAEVDAELNSKTEEVKAPRQAAGVHHASRVVPRALRGAAHREGPRDQGCTRSS